MDDKVKVLYFAFQYYNNVCDEFKNFILTSEIRLNTFKDGWFIDAGNNTWYGKLKKDD